jgi:fimbrial chaperone protein
MAMAKPIMAISGQIHRASNRFSLLLAALFFMISIPAAPAFTLTPIKMEFEPAGRGANQAFRLENNSSNTVPVQISMLTRQMDLEGNETNAPAEDDFLVYPPQVLLKPNQVQTVRVKWLGDPRPEQELAYRILAEQLPVDLDKEKASESRINVIIRYLGVVYIVPKGAKADVVLESAGLKNNAEGKNGIELIFHNRGTKHTLLE